MNTRTPPTATILVGDDDAAIRTVVRRALLRHGFASRDTGYMGELWSWISS